jgi:hypothetical protein
MKIQAKYTHGFTQNSVQSQNNCFRKYQKLYVFD